MRDIEIIPDGNCQFRSIAYGLFDDQELYNIIKSACLQYINEHKDFFTPYVLDIDEYIELLRYDGAWGDELSLLAVAYNYDIIIEIYNENNQLVNIYGINQEKNKHILLRFNEEHYNYIQL